MPAYDNTYPKPVCIEDIEVQLHCPFEDFRPLRIIEETDFSNASQFTDFEYVNYLEGEFNDVNVMIVMDYIRALMSNRKEVHLFNTWMGDESLPVVKKVRLDSLKIKDIDAIWRQEFFEQNECLIVIKG